MPEMSRRGLQQRKRELEMDIAPLCPQVHSHGRPQSPPSLLCLDPAHHQRCPLENRGLFSPYGSSDLLLDSEREKISFCLKPSLGFTLLSKHSNLPRYSLLTIKTTFRHMLKSSLDPHCLRARIKKGFYFDTTKSFSKLSFLK